MWEDHFATSEGYVYGTVPTGFLITHNPYLTPGQKALSIADGEGRNSVYLAEQGLDVTALEFASSALARAKALAQARNVFVDYRAFDILTDTWQETNTYDLVLAVFVQFTGPEGRMRQFDGMKVSCKPGGLVMIHGYTPKQLEFGTGGPPSEQNMYTEAQMRSDFTGWDILECTSYEREVQEGAGHSGMSALLDFVARKPT